MKRITALLLCVLLLCAVALPLGAADAAGTADAAGASVQGETDMPEEWKNGRFFASPEMLTLFQNDKLHNVIPHYIAEDDVIALSSFDICKIENHITPEPQYDFFHCDAFGSAGVLDVQTYFDVPGTLPAEYKYMVMTYMSPFDLALLTYDLSGTQYDAFYEPFPGYIDAEVFPESVSGNPVAEYSRSFRMYERSVWYTNYVYLGDSLKNETLDYIRIDPFNVHFASAGATLYIKSIIFCETLAEAEAIIRGDIVDEHTYSYKLTYDANANGAAVLGMPEDTMTMYTDNATLTLSVDGTQTPVREGCTFLGWAEAPSGAPMSGDSITIAGVANETVTKTLYAVWDVPEEEASLTTLTVYNNGTPYGEEDALIFDILQGDTKIASVTVGVGERITVGSLTVGEDYTVRVRGAKTRYGKVPSQTLTAKRSPMDNVLIFESTVENGKWLGASDRENNVFS